MRCQNCGAELPEGARFCYMCAAPVVSNDGEGAEAGADVADVGSGVEVSADDEKGAAAGLESEDIAEDVAAPEVAEGAEDPAAPEVSEPASADGHAPAEGEEGSAADGADAEAGEAASPADPSTTGYLSSMPEPVKLEGALPVGAVPFVPMAPAPRSTYVPRHNARPVRSGRPGMSSTAGIPNGTPIHARQHDQGWSLEGVTPRDPKNMVARRNESDDPIGSLRNKMNKAFSTIGGSPAAREERKRAEREAFDAAYAEQLAEESRARARAEAAARRAVIHAEQAEARAALAEDADAEENAPQADVEAAGVEPTVAKQVAGEQIEAEKPASEQVVTDQQAANSQINDTVEAADIVAAEPADEEREPAYAAPAPELGQPADAPEQMPAPAPAAEPADLTEEVLEAEDEDPGIEPLPDPNDISGLWADAPGRVGAADDRGPADAEDDLFEIETTRDLGSELHERGVRQPRDGRASDSSAAAPRRISSRTAVPRAIVAGVALLVVAIVAFGAVTMMGSPAKTATQQQEDQASTQQQEAVPAEEQQEESAEETKSELAVRAAVNDYSWDELSQISALISSAPSDAEGLAVAKKYNLCTAAGTLDGTQVKALQLSDGNAIGMRIVGLRQDTRADGSGKAGITMMADSTVGAQAMNDGDAADWSETSLRTWLNGEFLSLLPTEVSGRIVEVAKTTTRATDMSAQETTADKVWLLSYSELVGDIDSGSSRSGSYIQEGSQYQMFSDFGCVWSENSEHYEVGGGLARWWTRSPDPLSSSNVIAPDNETGAPGYARNHAVSDAVGVVPAFCI